MVIVKKFKFYHFVLVHFALTIATYIARHSLDNAKLDGLGAAIGAIVAIAASYLTAYVVYKYIDRSIDRSNSKMASE